MKKKVMICYADYGFGYRSVAEYIKDYFENKSNFDVTILNISDYCNEKRKLSSFFKNNNLFYNILNNKISNKGDVNYCIKLFDSENLRNIFKEINPDIVISTHFYASYIVSFYNSTNVIHSKNLTVISGSSHLDLWTINHGDVDAYVVQNDIVKNEMIKYQVNSKKIFSFGIPINRGISNNLLSKDLVVKRYSLSGERPIYLFFGGGSYGYDYVFDYFRVLVMRNYPIDIVFIAGNNKELKVKCENFILKNNIMNVLVLGFSKDIDNLLNVSDVVITKPGSKTLNECIEMKKPVILIPGVCKKEFINAKYIVKSHYGVKVRGSHALARRVKIFLNYPFLVNSMRNKLLKLDDNESVKKIFELTNKLLGK